MTTNIEFDAVSNSWDEHTSAAENHISTGVQVAQATTGQAASEPVPVDVGSGAPAQGAANAPAANQPAADAPAANAPASNATQGNAPAGNAPAANAAAANVPHEYHAEAGNVVKLPANVSIDNIKVDGHNLVLVQPDGSEIVIKDGALNVPTFILGDVEVPRVALIAALEASHVDVAFGADGSISAGGNGSPSSAGGNFEQPAGGIGDGFGLTALLPPTDLAFGQPDHRELFPGLAPNHTPTILDLTPSVEGGDTTVNEKGLPASSGSEGSGEAQNPAPNTDQSETNTGTFTINSPDGIGSVTINGQVISGAALANSGSSPIDITTPLGNTLTINGYDAATGQVSYTYTLLHAEHQPNPGTDSIFDNITVTVTDGNGDVSLPGTLSVQIVDDVPTANPDTDAVAAGSHAPIDGNVITGSGSDGNAAGADVKGADDASVTSAYGKDGASSAQTVTDAGVSIAGQYGTLLLHSDGSYTYTRAANTPGGVDDVFHYTLTDGDGDQSSTTLTIHVGNADVTVGAPGTGPGVDAVYEAGLTDGSQQGNTQTVASGSLTVTAPDGVGSITVGGQTVALDGTHTSVPDGSRGSLEVWWNGSSIQYQYTLQHNYLESPAANNGQDTEAQPQFAVVVTDQDGSAGNGNLVINIVDDVPTAHADTDSVAANQFSAETGNVLTAVGTTSPATGVDVLGADGATVAGVAAGNTNANLDSAATVGTVIQGTYGKLTLNADGSYSYVRDAGTQGGHDDVFTYTIKDGDGDLSHTTLTISIGDSTPSDSIPAPGLASTTVYEAGLPPHGGLPAGSGEIADGNPNNNSNTSETTSGTIGFTSPDGISVVSLGGHVLSGVPQTFTDATGSLTASYVYDANTGLGTISYAYTLATNTSGDNTSVSFAVGVTDSDGDSAPAGNLVINIVDDVPTAHADTDSVAANQFSAETGNVLTAVGTTSPATGVDVLGADGATVAGVAAGNTNANLDSAATVGTVIQGTYGKLTLNADGSYSYVRDAGTQGGHDDVFTYTIKDGDGDLSHTTLTISIGDSTPSDSIPAPGLASTTVYEAGLPPHGGLPAGSGEIADGNPNNNSNTSETTSGTIGFTSPDGISVVSLGGHVLSGVPQTFTDATGSLTASYVYDANTGLGTISYAYTLATNTSGDNTSVSFAVGVTDSDGDSAPAGNLVINIVDDVPTAHADTDSVAANQFSAETGNVLTAVGTTSPATGVDVLGADGATVAGVAAGNTNANLDSAATVGTVIQGTYGKLTLNADGSYSYVRDAGTQGGHDDVFTYTIKDGDGDLSHTTLTISIGDSTPSDSIPAPGLASTTVYEAGLPPHGGLPAGSGEIADGNPNNNSNTSETTSGTIGFTSPDGISVVSLGGHVLSGVPQTFTDATGSLTASYVYDANTGLGTISYAYTLATNTSGDNTSVSFAVGVTDSDGDSAPAGNLVINIVDDVPTAHADTDSVAANQFSAETGNVLTAVGTTSPATGVDVLGADGATVAGVAAGNTNANLDSAATVGTVIQGTYGKLTLNADGSYSYVRDAGTQGGHDDVFTYTIKDGDGDLSHTTLTISIGDSTPSDSIPAPGLASTTVYEAGLPPHGGLPAGSGEIADGNPNNNSNTSETTSGTIGFTSPDGISVVSLGGHVLSGVPQTFTDATGSLTASYVYDANTGLGTISYAYTLATNTSGDNTSVSFAVGVTDSDGDSAPAGNLVINIVDDVPTAHADTDSVAANQFSAETGNVLTAVGTTSPATGVDVLGADGATVAGVAAGNTNANLDSAATVGTVIQGTYGKLTLNADGSYSYVRDAGTQGGHDDVFTYTIKDGDGDLSHTTLTISIGDSTPSDSIPAPGLASTTVYEAGLPPHGGLPAGSGEIADGNPNNNSNTSETTSGTIGFTSPDGISVVSLGGHVLSGVPQTFTDATGSLTASYVYDANTGLGTISYAYTLATNTSGDNTSVSFAVGVTDSDGDSAPAGNLVINIVDDVPTAHADTGNVTEGALLTVSAANGVLTNDTAGADGFAAGGGVVGVRAAGGDTTTAVTTGVDAQIAGQYGTLTLHADGSYSYQATANAISANATDTFVYTIKDGDGDTSTTTLAIDVANVTLTADNQTKTVDEAALDTVTNPGDLGHGTVTGSNPSSTAETVSGQLAVAGTGVTYTPISTTTAHGIFQLTASGAWTYTLTSPFDSGATQGANTLSGAESFTYTAKDANGNTVTGTVKIDVIDDVPTLGTVQSQQASNDPSQAPAIGTLHFAAGADGAGSAMTITANTTGITSAGHNLITEQVGNVLTAYADNNNNGTHDAGDSAVFTITVNPNAGTSGQYTFDLLAPLDGTVSNVSIASNGAYGSGPSNSIVVTAGGQNVVMVTGWAPTGSFNEASWLAGGNPALNQTSNVNGSSAGWGLGNNNFDAGEFMRFDFGTPNDYDGAGGYTPPAITIANVSYAKFSFDAVTASDKIEFVAHYTDGTTAAFIPTVGATALTINSPAGQQIAWVDAYESSGKTKLNLTDVGVTTTTVDHTIPVTLQLTDGDGDKTGTANFTVHVAAGLTPFALAAPVVLDLNHDGIHTTDLTHSTVSFDYNGDGVASKTAWVDTHDGILAIDLNGDGKVNNGSEIVFTQHAPGAATDLAALEQLYDTNHDGKLTAADQDFAKFGVWQDANGNGIADAGEFKSLAALGIVEIGLESNHQQSVSADGSVVTYGEATYTTADGQTGAVGDIGFGNYDGVPSGTSTIAGTSGADTFKIDNLNIKDLIADYHGAEGDKIDLTALFDKAPAGNIADYVHYNSATSTVSVDTSGSGNAANFVDVAVLQNAPAAGTINILYDDSNHQQHTATI